MSDIEEHLTKAQIAARWQVTTRTIENMVKRGDCPKPIRLSYKLIRWRLDDIEAFEQASR